MSSLENHQEHEIEKIVRNGDYSIIKEMIGDKIDIDDNWLRYFIDDLIQYGGTPMLNFLKSTYNISAKQYIHGLLLGENKEEIEEYLKSYTIIDEILLAFICYGTKNFSMWLYNHPSLQTQIKNLNPMLIYRFIEIDFSLFPPIKNLTEDDVYLKYLSIKPHMFELEYKNHHVIPGDRTLYKALEYGNLLLANRILEINPQAKIRDEDREIVLKCMSDVNIIKEIEAKFNIKYVKNCSFVDNQYKDYTTQQVIDTFEYLEIKVGTNHLHYYYDDNLELFKWFWDKVDADSLLNREWQPTFISITTLRSNILKWVLEEKLMENSQFHAKFNVEFFLKMLARYNNEDSVLIWILELGYDSDKKLLSKLASVAYMHYKIDLVEHLYKKYNILPDFEQVHEYIKNENISDYKEILTDKLRLMHEPYLHNEHTFDITKYIWKRDFIINHPQ